MTLASIAVASAVAFVGCSGSSSETIPEGSALDAAARPGFVVVHCEGSETVVEVAPFSGTERVPVLRFDDPFTNLAGEPGCRGGTGIELFAGGDRMLFRSGDHAYAWFTDRPVVEIQGQATKYVWHPNGELFLWALRGDPASYSNPDGDASDVCFYPGRDHELRSFDGAEPVAYLSVDQNIDDVLGFSSDGRVVGALTGGCGSEFWTADPISGGAERLARSPESGNDELSALLSVDGSLSVLLVRTSSEPPECYVESHSFDTAESWSFASDCRTKLVAVTNSDLVVIDEEAQLVRLDPRSGEVLAELGEFGAWVPTIAGEMLILRSRVDDARTATAIGLDGTVIAEATFDLETWVAGAILAP